MLSFCVGSIPIEPGLTLAPMAGQTNMAFRKLCRELGGVGLVCTELISSQLIEKRSTFEYYTWDASEHPLAVQLYGANPAQMAEAARIVVDRGAPIVDINMGCWVPKVVKKGGGAALLDEPCQAAAVVEAVVKAVPVPVTVKVRTGVTASKPTAVPFARLAEEAGAAAIAVHARTAEQGFSGLPDWDVIRQVREAVSIPVLGNGDISTAAEAREMVAQTGCHGVMIGRAALGQPWIFAQLAGLRSGDPDRSERARLALRHLELTRESTNLSERHAVLELRGQISRYRLDLPGETAIRDQLVRVDTWAQTEGILQALIENVQLSGRT